MRLAVAVALALAACSESAPPANGAEQQQLDAVLAIAPDGWAMKPKAKRDGIALLSGETTIDGVRVGVIMNAGRCQSALLCPSLELAAFTEHAEVYRAMLPEGTREAPAVFEVAGAKLADREVMTAYAVAWTPDTTGHNLHVHWNDGKRQLTLWLYQADRPQAPDSDAFVAAISRAPLDKAAEQLVESLEGKL